MTCFSCLFPVQVVADTILVSFFGSATWCRFLNSIHLNVLLVLSIFTGLCSCSSLFLPRILHPCKCKFQAWWATLWKKTQLLEVIPDLAQEKLKSSQIKRKSALIQSTLFKAIVLQLISLCQGPSAKCSFWNSEEGLGHLQRCSLESRGWRKSLPVQLDFLELLYLLQCPLLTLPFPTQNLWVPLPSGHLNPLWAKQSALEVDSWLAEVVLGHRAPHFARHVQGSCVPVSLTENCQGN